LAAATGGTLVHDPSGPTSVEFPPPHGVIARQAVGVETAEAVTAPAAVTAPSVSPPSAAAAPLPSRAPTEMDDVYDHVIRRLRRELLVEREAMGDLTGDLF
jgi:hypothetical protein